MEANGLPKKYRDGFLYGERGILKQGTGLAEDGQFITINWNEGGPQGRNTVFIYGKGGAYGPPIPWKTVAADPAILPMGSKIVIDIYKDKGTFTVTDTGGGVSGLGIDVFVGELTLAEADILGYKTSRVGIVQP